MGSGCVSTPVLYKANETNFNHLGLGALADSMNVLVPEERNGQFYLEMDYPVDGVMFKELKNDRLIKADASNNLKQQRFKIVRITKPSKGIVSIYAEHISYHTQEMQLKPLAAYSGNAQSGLNAWKDNIVDSHPFTVYSDITHLSHGEWSIEKVENARKALGGVAGSILDSYGGEYRFDNYHIGLYQNRGNDNGALIAYGKNLTELEQEEEIANTYTSVYPYSVFTEEGSEESKLITLPEYFVDSEYVSNFARRKILLVDFSEEKIADATRLRTVANQYVKNNGIGIPKINLKVKFVDLAKTLDYEHLKIVEEINLCDWVNIYFEELGIRSRAKVIKTVWNVLLDRYEEIELGESRASLSQSIETTVDGKLETVRSQLNTIQISVDGKTKTYRGPVEPTEGKIGDLWYNPIGDGQTEMYQHDGSFWRFIMSTAKLDQVEKDVAEALDDIEEVRQSSNDAVAKADAAIQEAGFANDTAETAKGNALTAIEEAEAARENANSALTEAAAATEKFWELDPMVKTAFSNANLALEDAGEAYWNAGEAVRRVGLVETTTNSLTTSFDEITQTVGLKADKTTVNGINQTVEQQGLDISANADGIASKADKTFVDLINGTVTDHTTQIKQTANALEIKADKTEVNTLKGTVETQGTSISQNAEDIISKAEKTVVDTLKGTIDGHSTLISQNATAITSKASQTSVNTLTGTVNGHTTLISQNATEITSKADKTVVDAINKTVGTHTTQISQNATTITSKADKTEVNTLKGTVESQATLISQNATAITSKASQTAVNTLSGTVSSQATLISQNATAISARLTETQVNSLLGTKNYVNQTTLNATANGLSATISQISTDLGKTDTKVVTLTATVNGIQTTVGTKANQSQVTQLATQISTKVESSTYSTKMTQLDNAINLRVTSGEVTTAILADKRIKDTRSRNETPQWYWENYPRQTVEEFKYRATIGVPGGQTYVTLTTEVQWTDASGGAIIQTAKSPDGTYQRTSSGTGWKAWDLLIDGSSLISQINIQSGNILIQTGKLYLDAATVAFSGNAFIPSAAITTLDAGKITAGTLNAANVNIINMNASRITAGTLQSIDIRGSRIYASEFRQDDSSSINNTLVTILKSGIWAADTAGKLTVNIDKAGIVLGGTATIGSQTRITNNEIYVQNHFTHNMDATGATTLEYLTVREQAVFSKGLRFTGSSTEAPANARALWFGTIGGATGLWCRQFDSSTVWKRFAFVEEI